MTETFHSTPYGRIEVGAKASVSRVLTQHDIEMFAAMSGDVNPQHMDAEWSAKHTRFGDVIAHGLWTGALISTVLGTRLPGPGTIFKRIELKFRRPVYLGDEVTASVEAIQKLEKGAVLFTCLVVNQKDEAVLKGESEVIAPTEESEAPHPPVPKLRSDG